MKYKIHKCCNICKSSHSLLLYSIGDQNLLKCLKCGLVYFDKIRCDLGNLYNADYYIKSESNNAIYFNYYSFNQEILMKGNFGFAYKFIEENIKDYKKYNLLDVGSGFGYFINYLSRKVEASAVEVSKKGAEECRRLGIKVYKGDFIKYPILKKFDFITAFDVMEHQIDLKKFYKRAASLLKPEGVLIFTVPNIGSVFNKILGKRAPAVQPPYHNYYFDLDWFKKNLPDLGWEIISLKKIFVAKITIDHLMLMSGIAFPQIANNKIFKTLRKYKLGAKIIPFIRMGGIEGIIQKK